MLQLLIRNALCRQAAGKRVQRRADFKDLIHIADGQIRHISPPPGHHNHVALQLQLAYSLTYRGTAHPQLLRKLNFHQSFPGCQHTLADGITQGFTHNLPERLITIQFNRCQLFFHLNQNPSIPYQAARAIQTGIPIKVPGCLPATNKLENFIPNSMTSSQPHNVIPQFSPHRPQPCHPKPLPRQQSFRQMLRPLPGRTQ